MKNNLKPGVITFFSHWLAWALFCSLGLFGSVAPGWTQNVIAWGDNSQGQCNVPPEATNVIAVASGLYHSLALRADGSVVGWGSTNAVPNNLTGVTAIAAGLFHSLALRADGTVVAWGDNTYGQTTVPSGATNVVAISAGYYLNLALRADGTVISWGHEPNTLPVTIPASLTNVVAVGAGSGMAYLVQANGKVVAVSTDYASSAYWGSHFTSVKDIVAISTMESRAAALTGRGQVVDRRFRVPKVPGAATSVVALTARTNYSLALRSDGVMIGWGQGPLTNLPAAATNIISIAAGGYHALAVRGDAMAPLIVGPAAYRDFAAVGDVLPLSTRAVGAQPLHYQWLADGIPIAATDTAFPQVPGSPGTHGYQVVVSNSFGCVTSVVATVTVSSVNVWGDNLNGQCVVPKSVSNPLAVAGGGGHCLVLNSNGQVVTWGKNRDGQVAVPDGAYSNVVAIAAGSDHSIALKADGTLVAWGRNWDGQTNIPPEAVDVVAVSAGWAHNLALKRDGTVLAWGNNDYGQTNTALLPTNFIAIAAGYFHSAALRSDGTVVTWGWSVPTPGTATNVVAIAAGWEHCLALRSDGTVIAWGDNSYGESTVPAEATNVIAIAAGYYHNLALRSDGSVIAWERGACGVTNLPVALTNAAAISAGGDFSMAMAGQGAPLFSRQPLGARAGTGGQVVLGADISGSWPMLFQWFHDGVAINGATNRFLVLSNVQASDSGGYVLMATNPAGQATSQTATLNVSAAPIITTSSGLERVALGQMFCLSPTVFGVQPLSFQWQHFGTNISDDSQVSGTSSAVLCIRSASYADAGTYSLIAENGYGSSTSVVAQVLVSPVIAWGDDSAGELEIPATATNIVAVAAGGLHSLAVHGDGSLLAWGDDTYGQNEPPAGATNIVAVAEGQFHSVALRADGQVLCWGNNSFGQTNVPASATNAVAIAAGASHTLALRNDGSMIAWGSNTNGQTTVPSSAMSVVAIAASDFASFALRADGIVVAWGRGPTAPMGRFVQIASGDNHLLALQPNGTVTASGANTFDQASVPDSVTGIIAVAAGGDHSLALSAAGDIEAWGANYSGETIVPANATNVVAIAAGDAHNLALVADPGSATAPAIVQQPLSRIVSPGGTFVLNAGVVGGLPLSYQWYFNSAALPGETMPWLARQNAQASQAGSYQLVVTNSFGSITSRVATIQVQVLSGAPTINSQPQGQTATQGWNVSLTVSANGYPLYFQWMKDGLPLTNGGRLAGTTATQLWITNVQPEDAGSYSVTLSNSVGQTASGPAVLTVVPPTTPVITMQPPAQLTVLAGTNLDLAVSAIGDAPLSYQWRFNQIPLSGKTTSVLSLVDLQAVDTGNYDLVITNAYGSVTSSVTKLTVNATVAWFNLPTNSQPQVASVGQDVDMAVTAFGTEPLSYQWQHNGSPVTSATNSTLHLQNVQGVDGGAYQAIVSNSQGSSVVEIDLAVVPVVAWGAAYSPALALPASATNMVAVATVPTLDGAACLGLRADGTLVGWGYDVYGDPSITNYSTATNMIGIAVGGLVWSNSYYLGLSADGSVQGWGSNPAAQAPAALTDAVAVAAGGKHALALRENGRLLAWGDNSFGQSNVPASATNVVAIAAGSYHNLALRADGQVIAWGDNSVGQTDLPPYVTNIVAIAAAGSNNLALRADGKVFGWSPGSAWWTNPPIAVSNLVAIAPGTAFDLALWADGKVLAWGPDGDGTSLPWIVTNNHVLSIAAGNHYGLALVSDDTVPIPPRLGRDLSSHSAAAGDTVMFYAGSVGTQPMSFEWRYDGTPLAGQTNAWLALAAAQPDQAGSYQVVITNTFGAVTSSVATVSLTLPAPMIIGPVVGTNGLELSFYAFRSIQYTIEYTDRLDTPVWQALETRVGQGALETVALPTTGGGNRFYRLRCK